jgi:hypothetical protein
MVAYRQHIREANGNFLHVGNHTIIILYIPEQPYSWSTSRIHPFWPQSRVRLRLLLVLSPKYISCLFWPTQYLAVCSNSSFFALNPCLADWRLNISVQVNNTTALHHIYTDTHIYITLILWLILFSTLLLLSLAGRLPPTLPVCHNEPSLTQLPLEVFYFK